MLQRRSRADKKQRGRGAKEPRVQEDVHRKRVIFFPPFFCGFFYRDLIVRFQSWEFIFSPIGAGTRVRPVNLRGGRTRFRPSPGRGRDPSLFPFLSVFLHLAGLTLAFKIRISLRTGARAALNRIRIVEGAQYE